MHGDPQAAIQFRPETDAPLAWMRARRASGSKVIIGTSLNRTGVLTFCEEYVYWVASDYVKRAALAAVMLGAGGGA